MVNDPIADMLTRVRNAVARKKKSVVAPHSKILEALANVMREEGFIEDYEVVTDEAKPQADIQIKLKYVNGEPAISRLKRVSRPGVRVYHGYREIRPILRGRGISIYSTPGGVLSGREARKQQMGGECLCQIW